MYNNMVQQPSPLRVVGSARMEVVTWFDFHKGRGENYIEKSFKQITIFQKYRLK
jgi:hypothetical protein